jgi:hypothetical protein
MKIKLMIIAMVVSSSVYASGFSSTELVRVIENMERNLGQKLDRMDKYLGDKIDLLDKKITKIEDRLDLVERNVTGTIYALHNQTVYPWSSWEHKDYNAAVEKLKIIAKSLVKDGKTYAINDTDTSEYVTGFVCNGELYEWVLCDITNGEECCDISSLGKIDRITNTTINNSRNSYGSGVNYEVGDGYYRSLLPQKTPSQSETTKVISGKLLPLG